MVGVGGLASANQAGLGRNELQVFFVANPLGFADGELALVDLGWNGLCRRERWRSFALGIAAFAPKVFINRRAFSTAVIA